MNIEDSAIVALVTGGNRGVGKAVFLRLADQGIHTVVAARSLEEGEKVSRHILKKGGSSEAVSLDVQSEVIIEVVVRRPSPPMGQQENTLLNGRFNHFEERIWKLT